MSTQSENTPLRGLVLSTMSGFNNREIPMSQQEGASYTRTQEYFSTTPRYPAALRANSTINFFNHKDDGNDSDTVIVDKKLFEPSLHAFAEGDFIPPAFFKKAHLDGFTRRFKYSQWAYEMRREAQLILPFLALGPSSCLRDREYLRTQGFTLLLGVRNTLSAHARLVSGEMAAAELGIQADTIDVMDNQELISAFPRAIRRINNHLAGCDVSNGFMNMNMNTGDMIISDNQNQNQSEKKKILVFCETGNERSAGVIIAYIMAMLNQDAMSATRMIQQHRFCVSIEEPLKRILNAFESILAAKRDVEKARRMAVSSSAPSLAPPPVPAVLLAKKRSFQVRQEEDAAMDGGMDMDMDDDSMVDRKPIAPFQDRVV
ncbi:hypothetical protein N7478_000923 [Penicillium angulare]|uniref:uncharacterized protein n=1 Tax=Penicillium angulare TaxID=116970 RepID=UPI00254021D5|nr:uncharacterized protein N7478_000923 [Penicillium angulare]KAJ5291672.1 hypothetical protein N7478_000923 [Penicillium angulare]